MADAFPVASSSDEFHYFPQVTFAGSCEEKWDSFSPDAVEDFAAKLSGWENELDRLKNRLCEIKHFDSDEGIDVALLLKVIRTLKEQLSEVRSWEYQPTFYLTLAGLGMADAIESENPAAKHKRAERLPAFLDQAGHTLTCVPLLFRDLGLEMLPGTRDFFAVLQQHIPELKPALVALDRFEDLLQNVSTRDSFHLPQEVVKRIIRFHINSAMDIEEVNQALDQEMHAMEECLHREARRLGRYQSWEEAYERIPMPDVGETGLIEVYRNQVDRLGKYCLEEGLISKQLFSTCPVQVAPMPPYLSPIRTASSYSIRPQNPPHGGSFYLINGRVTGDSPREYHREYKMLSAHETYPGHHLLDCARWSLERALRRPIEQPIFYEGWACFAEELLKRTGHFSHPGDVLLLAKRRLWRAIRGKVDIGLQTGSIDIPTAARYLSKAGMSSDHAAAAAGRYLLNPGYQLCYTLGILRFIDLFDHYGPGDVPGFVQCVLGQGEISFDDLERVLKERSTGNT